MEKYLQSGVLEEYCLGLLPLAEANEITLAARQFPVLLQKIQEIELSLISYSNISGNTALKQNILTTLDNTTVSSQIDLSNPPPINRMSELNQWNEAVKDIEPTAAYGPIKVHFISKTAEFELCVAWLEEELNEGEHHTDEFAESFFILEGSCSCNIGGQIIHLKAGDFLDIPFDTSHSIKSTSPELGYVKAILQRRKLAA